MTRELGAAILDAAADQMERAVASLTESIRSMFAPEGGYETEEHMNLPKWKCHKVVEAAKIEIVAPQKDGAAALFLAGGCAVEVDAMYLLRNVPGDGPETALRGGYFVRYANGYESWSPADAFERGYTPVEQRHDLRYDFGHAVAALKDGLRVARDGWNGKGMWLELQTPDAHSKMTLPYVFMRTAQGDLVPWLASQTDILAEDWRLA